MTARAQLRIAMESECRRLADLVAANTRDSARGFCLLLFDFGPGAGDPFANVAYVSSAQRPDTLRLLRELGANLERGVGPGGIAERVVELETAARDLVADVNAVAEVPADENGETFEVVCTWCGGWNDPECKLCALAALVGIERCAPPSTSESESEADRG